METRHIGITLAAQQYDFAMDIGFIFLGCEAAVIVLPVTGCHRNILRQLKEIIGVAADGTGQAATGPARGNFYFFLHQTIHGNRFSFK